MLSAAMSLEGLKRVPADFLLVLSLPANCLRDSAKAKSCKHPNWKKDEDGVIVAADCFCPRTNPPLLFFERASTECSSAVGPAEP